MRNRQSLLTRRLLLVATLAMPACALDPAPADPVRSTKSPVLGFDGYGADCNPGMKSFLDKTMQFGRTAALSSAFADCMNQSASTAIWVPGPSNDSFLNGPYRVCNGDPFSSVPLAWQVTAAMSMTSSPDAVTINCTGGSGNASTGIGTYDTVAAEGLSFSGWLAGVYSAQGTTSAWPASQAAGIIWHEAAHDHGYTHGADNQADAIVACGYAGDPTWNFQVNTMPYIIGTCISGVLDRSEATCGHIEDGCGAGYMRLVDSMSSSSCSCMPIVMADQPAKDLNADGWADLLFQNTTTGDLQAWLMNGIDRSAAASINEQSTQAPLQVAAGWSGVGIGDFNSDLTSDLVFQNSTTGEIQIWLMSGTNRIGFSSIADATTGAPLLGGWPVVGVGDFDKDGQTDILFQDPQYGELEVWMMTGTNRRTVAIPLDQSTQQPFFVHPPWRVGGLGDFNSDGWIDIAWQNTSTGEIQVWFMNGTNRTSFAYVSDPSTGQNLIVPAPWELRGAGDMNLDNHPDLIFRDATTGNVEFSYMDGITRPGFADVRDLSSNAIISAPSPWSLVSN